MARSFTHGIVRLVISFPSERSTKTVRFLDQKWSHFRFFFFPCLLGCCVSSREVQLIVTSSMTRGFWSSSPLISSFSLRSAMVAGMRDYPPQFDRILWEPVDLQVNLSSSQRKAHASAEGEDHLVSESAASIEVFVYLQCRCFPQ